MKRLKRKANQVVYLYHGTSSINAEKILRDGELKPNDGSFQSHSMKDSDKRGVYFYTEPDYDKAPSIEGQLGPIEYDGEILFGVVFTAKIDVDKYGIIYDENEEPFYTNEGEFGETLDRNRYVKDLGDLSKVAIDGPVSISDIVKLEIVTKDGIKSIPVTVEAFAKEKQTIIDEYPNREDNVKNIE